jgi:ubiquinone/menaquinone biosynthesis C-methylase UbiE
MPKFIDPGTVVSYVGLKTGNVVADLGCGAGFFAVAAARVVGNSGTVYAVDVQDSKLAATQSAAKQYNLNNIITMKADLDKPFLEVPEGQCDVVIMASILHEIDSREELLKNVYRLLKTGGKILAVEWKKVQTPFGPDMAKRLSPEELAAELTALGIKHEAEVPADSYHYASVFIK